MTCAGTSTAHGNAILAPLCGDQRCTQACTGDEDPAAAANCLPPAAPNATGPTIQRDCFEHNVFGGECAACNVTDSCPEWCGEVRSAGCRPYEMICGYVETVQFQGPREDLVTRGPLFCRKVECADFGPGEGDGDACWFAVDGHEICCIDGVPTYVTGSGQVVRGFGGAEAPGPAAAVAPGEVEADGVAESGRRRGGRLGMLGVSIAWLTVGIMHAGGAGGG